MDFLILNFRKFLLLAIALPITILVNAQEEENKPFLDDFRGTASITHNGISLVPSFSLGDPAAIFDIKMKETDSPTTL